MFRVVHTPSEGDLRGGLTPDYQSVRRESSGSGVSGVRGVGGGRDPPPVRAAERAVEARLSAVPSVPHRFVFVR